MKLLTARLIENPKVVTTKYGARMVADAQTTDGEKLSVWRPENDQTLGSLRSGAQVVLSLDSKGKVNLIDNPPETMTPQLPPAPTETKPAGNKHALSPETKREIADYVTQQKDLLSYCWQQAATIPGVSEEQTLEKLAVTLYLSAQRRFNLA